MKWGKWIEKSIIKLLRKQKQKIAENRFGAAYILYNCHVSPKDEAFHTLQEGALEFVTVYLPFMPSKNPQRDKSRC